MTYKLAKVFVCILLGLFSKTAQFPFYSQPLNASPSSTRRDGHCLSRVCMCSLFFTSLGSCLHMAPHAPGFAWNNGLLKSILCCICLVASFYQSRQRMRKLSCHVASTVSGSLMQGFLGILYPQVASSRCHPRPCDSALLHLAVFESSDRTF